MTSTPSLRYVAALILAVPFAAHAQQVPRDSAGRDSARTLRTVEIRGSVSGLGKVRGGNAITRADLQANSPGTTPIKAVERLPGVNFQSSDPFGGYEWSNRVTIRGFQTQQIGQTFDGITLGDMTYGNFNGLGVGRAVDSDNLQDATVTQGSGALGTASSNNLGGVVQYTSADPRNVGAFTFRQMVGEANARRTFGRWDSGLRGNLTSGHAIRSFVSYSRLDTDKWKGSYKRYSPEARSLFGTKGLLGGAGEQWQDQVNAKVQALVGAHKITAFYDFTDRTEGDYTDFSLARFNQSGRDWDQFSDWNTAKAYATGQTPDEAYFHSAHGARRDNLAYVQGELKLGEQATLAVTPYIHTNRGAGDWHAPNYGSTAFSPDPIYFRQTQYDGQRFGVTARLGAKIAANQLEAGLWYEDNETNIRRVAWRLEDYATSPDVDFSNVLRLFFDRTGNLKTTTFYLQNTNSLLDDRLKLTYGAKYLHIGAEFTNNGKTIPNAASAPDVTRPNLSLPTDGGFLPQLGLVYSATETEQLFANFSQNVNAYPYSPQSGVYNTNPQGFQLLKDQTDPEKANTYELGLRTRREGVEASIAGYYIDYKNRLIGVARCPLTATCVSSFANVGDVTTRGVEGLLSLRVVDGLTWQSTASYNRSTIDDNYLDGETEVPSSGKDVVDAPRIMLNSALKLNHKHLTASFGGRHVDKRYFTILNTLSVPSYTLFDGSVGYRFGRLHKLEDLTLQLNALNLFDKSYISSMGTGGFSVTDDLQTLQAGPRRLVFLTVGTSF